MKVVQAQLALRENTLKALVDLVDDEAIPSVLVDDELNQRVHDLAHRLDEQRISLPQLLAATGRTQESLLDELRGEAHRAVKADLALRAVAEAQELVVSDGELDDEVAAMAERMELTPGALRAELDRAGRTAAVRSEQRKAKALAWLLDHVELVDDDGNTVAREDLTIDQGDADQPGGDEPSEEDEGVPEAAISPGEAAVGGTNDAAAGATNEETTER